MTEPLLFASTISAVVLLLYASLHDAAFRTIPNWTCLAIAAAGVIASVERGLLLPALGVSALLLLLLGLLWLRGYIGGGDVKLIPATALLLPPHAVPALALSIALAGGMLAAIYLAASRVVPAPRPGPRRGLLARILKAEARRARRRQSMPYAVAITAGAVPVIFQSFTG